MARVAVLMAEGYEEGETITIVDILRRLEIVCHTFHFGENPVKGMHGLYVEADKPFSEEINEYDMIVLPGGRPGGQHLLENPDVIELVRSFHKDKKQVAAMCSGTVVLAAAGIIDGVRVTGYTGYADKLTGGIFCEDVVVVDQNIVTSQGPATPHPFAFRIAEIFGKDVSELKHRLMYSFAGGK